MRRRGHIIPALGLAGMMFAAGCGGWGPAGYEDRRLALELANALRAEALKLPDEEPRERLVTGLSQLREVLLGGMALKPVASRDAGPALPAPPGGVGQAPEWAAMFAPHSLVIGFFTQSKDFDGDGTDDGLEVRVQPLDRFGDPTKAVGSYRIEVFAYRYKSGQKRGARLGHWFVSVLDAKSNRKYYDPIDRSYVFPLLWEQPIEPGATVIVQATYYPPAGFDEKLIAQRVVKTGAD
ncbi:MAG: hypothetical protein WBD05_06310 [Phycisphaerae bacterium]